MITKIFTFLLTYPLIVIDHVVCAPLTAARDVVKALNSVESKQTQEEPKGE